jgi:hypothetical protein
VYQASNDAFFPTSAELMVGDKYYERSKVSTHFMQAYPFECESAAIPPNLAHNPVRNHDLKLDLQTRRHARSYRHKEVKCISLGIAFERGY